MASAAKSDQSKHDINSLKPGSNPADAAKVGGKGDFGVHENDVVGRAYTSANTKASDPGNAQANSFEHGEARQSGAGGHDSGPGSSSGGDIDTSVVGLGGSGLAQDIGKDEQGGAAETDGSSRNAASGGPARGENQTNVGKIGGAKPQLRDVMTPADDRMLNVGADAASNVEDDADDSFRGEISSAEASGRDQAGE